MNAATLPLKCLLLLSLVTFAACRNEVSTAQVVCTQEFRTVSLTVSGDTLTDFYTVRLSTGEVLRPRTGLEAKTRAYTVLDDTFQTKLAGRQEQFRFVGTRNKAIVIQEDYVIKADQCHIAKVSGRSEI